MSIIGLDLSLTSAGVAQIDAGHTPIVSRVKSEGHKGDSWARRHHRLMTHASRVLDHVPSAAELVVIEAPSYGSVTGSQHDRSGFWWLTYEAVARVINCPIMCVPPTTLKKYATGKGNAPKDAVLAATIRTFLDVPITGNDEADAMQLAAIGARYLGRAIDGQKLAPQMAAYDAFVETVKP